MGLRKVNKWRWRWPMKVRLTEKKKEITQQTAGNRRSHSGSAVQVVVISSLKALNIIISNKILWNIFRFCLVTLSLHTRTARPCCRTVTPCGRVMKMWWRWFLSSCSSSLDLSFFVCFFRVCAINRLPSQSRWHQQPTGSLQMFHYKILIRVLKINKSPFCVVSQIRLPVSTGYLGKSLKKDKSNRTKFIYRINDVRLMQLSLETQILVNLLLCL